MVYYPAIEKFLLRACSRSPHGRETLCPFHASQRDSLLQANPGEGEVASHRLKRALYAESDVCYLEVKMDGFAGWQPAETVNQTVLNRYCAKLADGTIRRRRLQLVFHTSGPYISIYIITYWYIFLSVDLKKVYLFLRLNI